MAPDEIVLGISRFEVNVSVEVVGKESRTALERHHNRAYVEHIFFFLRNFVTYTSQEACAVSLVKLFVKRNFRQIFLVLEGSIATEAYGIAEVIQKTSGRLSLCPCL